MDTGYKPIRRPYNGRERHETDIDLVCFVSSRMREQMTERCKRGSRLLYIADFVLTVPRRYENIAMVSQETADWTLKNTAAEAIIEAKIIKDRSLSNAVVVDTTNLTEKDFAIMLLKNPTPIMYI